MELETFKDRLIAFCREYTKAGYNAFEKKCGIPVGTIGGIRNGISTSTLVKIMVAYPELNVEWLLLGNGEMLKNGSNSHEKKASEDLCHQKGETLATGAESGKNGEVDFLREVIRMQQATINKLIAQ